MNKFSNIYVPIDLLWLKFGNKYEGLVKIISEAKQVVEITGDAPNSAIYKAINKLLSDEPVAKEPGKEITAETVKETEKEPPKETGQAESAK